MFDAHIYLITQMNKLYSLLLACLLSLACLTGRAQTTPHPAEQYCMVVATAKPFSTKVVITVDSGQETKFFGDKGTIKDETGKVQSFNSVIDALNYMSSQGWLFVNAYVVTVGGQNVYHYVMRRIV
jgi:hypothetical protein